MVRVITRFIPAMCLSNKFLFIDMQCLWRRLKRKTYGLNFDKESLEKSFKFACYMVQGEYLFYYHGINVWTKLQDLYEEELKQKENKKELIFEFLKEKVVKCISKYQKLSVIL